MRTNTETMKAMSAVLDLWAKQQNLGLIRWTARWLALPLRVEYKERIARLRAKHERQVEQLEAERKQRMASIWAEFRRQALAKPDQKESLWWESERWAVRVWNDYGRQIAVLEAAYKQRGPEILVEVLCLNEKGVNP